MAAEAPPVPGSVLPPPLPLLVAGAAAAFLGYWWWRVPRVSRGGAGWARGGSAERPG